MFHVEQYMACNLLWFVFLVAQNVFSRLMPVAHREHTLRRSVLRSGGRGQPFVNQSCLTQVCNFD